VSYWIKSSWLRRINSSRWRAPEGGGVAGDTIAAWLWALEQAMESVERRGSPISYGLCLSSSSFSTCQVQVGITGTLAHSRLLSPLSYAAAFTLKGQRDRMDRIFSNLRPKYALERNLYNRLVTLDWTMFVVRDWEEAARAGGFWVPVF
jgi:hypothetical protein